MALTKNMTKKQVLYFIDKELLPQAKMEIKNWIRPRKKQGGYFVTIRQILCMIDFLGVTCWGKPLSPSEKGKNLARAEKAINFITTFFEPSSTYTNETVRILYSMYRHGLVHLYQPKNLLMPDGKILTWFFYRGRRIMGTLNVDTNRGKKTFRDVEHLKLIHSSRNLYYLPICIDTMYDDFEKAVLKYRDKLEITKDLQKKWLTTVSHILKPTLV